MTARLFLSDAVSTAEPGEVVTLDGDEGRHAATVVRLSVGDPVLLSDGRGRRAEGVVTATAKASLAIRVERVETVAPPARRYTLVQALAKADRDLMAIETATELGVDRVIPWQAHRSIVVWRADRAAKAHAKWVSTVASAARQSRRANLPEVAELVNLKALAQRVSQAQTALVLHEQAGTALSAADLTDSGEILLIVGPEGGITEQETSVLTEAGAQPVRLGSEVLRSSTAGPAALAALLAQDRWR